ncbi:MAG: stage V sporulation protein AA [Clostridiales bacterium]|jgi:stage V sporulation protein AA|nr:stage V sporulation protein AA [Clostridiales bacterium]
MDIYIKPKAKINVNQKRTLTIKDIAEIEAPEKIAQKLLKSAVLNIKTDKKSNYLVSVLDIIKVIKKQAPGATVNNVGETDIIVSFNPDDKKQNPIIKVLMITFVTITLLMGSATAIMSFHSDAQMPKVFQNYHKIFFGKESEKPLIIDIPYSIGLACGIVIFFNHFLGKKLTEEPTPIEVEMTEYEDAVNNTIVEQLSSEDSKKADEGV